MSERKAIIFGDKEIRMEVISLPSKKKRRTTFAWKEIANVRVKNVIRGKLFWKKKTEKLEVMTANPEAPTHCNPAEFYKDEDKYFDEYIEKFKQAAAEGKVRFSDEREG